MMTEQSAMRAMDDAEMGVRQSTLLIGLAAFLTVVDLFGTQAILPTLARTYHVAPATMGVAVNASTFGMAASGLLVALFSSHINRRLGAILSLALLSIPTALLATMPSLPVFTALRVIQGLCMSSAFTLTLTYLAENVSEADIDLNHRARPAVRGAPAIRRARARRGKAPRRGAKGTAPAHPGRAIA